MSQEQPKAPSRPSGRLSEIWKWIRENSIPLGVITGIAILIVAVLQLVVPLVQKRHANATETAVAARTTAAHPTEIAQATATAREHEAKVRLDFYYICADSTDTASAKQVQDQAFRPRTLKSAYWITEAAKRAPNQQYLFIAIANRGEVGIASFDILKQDWQPKLPFQAHDGWIDSGTLRSAEDLAPMDLAAILADTRPNPPALPETTPTLRFGLQPPLPFSPSIVPCAPLSGWTFQSIVLWLRYQPSGDYNPRQENIELNSSGPSTITEPLLTP